ncbi:MAG: hypothetical protein R2746_06300 [Acidimicrobiales bacterium]
MPIQVNVVPHTHWDREWYKPYPVFRMQLVELLDGLLPQLSADDSYAHFQLDGQMAVVDDYLELRPGQRATLAELNATGRLTMGPWYTLPDEFLVSGETLVRDLRLGLARAASSAPPCASATSRTCSGTWPRCPRSWPGSGWPTRWCGEACRRPSSAGVLVGGPRRLPGARRAAARRLQQRRPPARSRPRPRGAGGGVPPGLRRLRATPCSG